jgi:hypothetical protein
VKRVAVGRGLATVVLGAALAVALVAGGPGGDGDQSRGKADPPAMAEETVPPPGPDTDGPAPDALCRAHDQLTAAVASLGAVDGPADFEAFVLAQLAFTSAAAEIEQEPEAGAFRSMSGYWGAVRSFYGARAWDQQVDLAEAGQLPRPPLDGSATRTAEILADRCGVTASTDTPT